MRVVGWGEFVGAARVGFDTRKPMVFFEEVVAFLEIAPESNEVRLIRMSGNERLEAVLGEARREDLNGQMLLALAMEQNCEPINFLDSIVGDGNTADRGAIPVKEDVSAGILMRTKNAVGCVGITDVQAQEKIALRIEPVEVVEAFGDLLIAESALGAKDA